MTQQVTTTYQRPYLTESDVLALFHAENNKIQAIKIVRQMTGQGLKEAKDFVEGPMMSRIRQMKNGELHYHHETPINNISIENLEHRLTNLENFIRNKWSEE